MRIRLIALTTALLPLASMAHGAWANDIPSTSKVVSATVFSDRALVTRESKIHIPQGPQTIALSDVPSGMIEASLRVQGKALAPVKIGTIEVKHVYLTEQANAAIRDKEAALQAKQDEKAQIEGAIKALQTKENFINLIASNAAQKQDAQGNAKLDFTPEKWAQAWNLLQSGMTDTQKDMVSKNIALRKADEAITQLQQELNLVRSSQAKQRQDILVHVDAAQETDLQLSISYQAPGASWQPVYEARLDTSDGSLQLEQYGQVTQISGEDWKDIDLTLSTAQPAMGSEMPQLREWFVSLLRPIMNRFSLAAVQSESAAGAMTAKLAAPMASMDAAAPPAPVEAAPVAASVQSTEYAAEFHVPGHVDVKSVREPTKLYIASTSMKSELEAQTSPRLDSQAYLFAKVQNGEDYPIIPGSVAKYRDGTFIGNASLPLLRSKESESLSFGVDDRLKVTYKKTNEKRDNPTLVVMGDMSIEEEFSTKVENLHKTPIKLTVFEQYPVSQDADVKSDLLIDQTSTGYEKDGDNRQGVIVWKSDLNSKDIKEYKIGYKVRYPKGKQINGL